MMDAAYPEDLLAREPAPPEGGTPSLDRERRKASYAALADAWRQAS